MLCERVYGGTSLGGLGGDRSDLISAMRFNLEYFQVKKPVYVNSPKIHPTNRSDVRNIAEVTSGVSVSHIHKVIHNTFPSDRYL